VGLPRKSRFVFLVKGSRSPLFDPTFLASSEKGLSEEEEQIKMIVSPVWWLYFLFWILHDVIAGFDGNTGADSCTGLLHGCLE